MSLSPVLFVIVLPSGDGAKLAIPTMSANLSTIENALQFRYFGNDHLYTDHEGRRVIADVEGFGIMRLVTADLPVLTVRSEVESAMFSPEFDNGAIVLAIGSGEVWVDVIVGRTTLIEGGSIRAEGHFWGCGWIIGASSDFSVDDRMQTAPSPSPQFPIPFFRSVKGTGKWSIIPAPSVRCELVDGISIADEAALKLRGFRVQNISALRELKSEFADGTVRTAPVASHLNAAVFNVSVPADNLGIIIRKIFDRFHGRQRARVFVDGEFAGWWYEPGEDRTCRWRISDFGVDKALTRGKDRLQITIDPPAGVALWSVSDYQIYALRPILE